MILINNVSKFFQWQDFIPNSDNSTIEKEKVSQYTNYLGSIQLLEAFFFGPIVGLVVDGSQERMTKILNSLLN